MSDRLPHGTKLGIRHQTLAEHFRRIGFSRRGWHSLVGGTGTWLTWLQPVST